MVESTENASRVVERELDWLDAAIAYRLRQYFQSDDANQPPSPPEPPCLDGLDTPYTRFLGAYGFDAAERLVLAFALATQLRPAMLDPFFTRNQSFDRPFTEFGGVNPGGSGAFLPTAQTALFILAGDDLDARIRHLALFSPRHPLYRANILVEPLGEANRLGPLHWPLRLAEEALQQMLHGERIEPEFSSAFPARRVESEMEWEDLVLNADTMEQVVEILDWIQHRETLLVDWQLEKRIRRGFRALFVGPPGTGKTLTASLIGKRSGLPVFRVDLSAVVSKYIGETEKNLELIFARAEREEWVLFFDEADALFGKRTQLKDAHDRYANQEVSYLLQRVEDFSGICILASNLKQNIDSAFLRRIHSVITFPPPSTDDLVELWKRCFGPDRLGADIDLRELSKRYRLTGGNIVNIARSSALRAASRGETRVNLRDVEAGIRKELQKSGRSL